MTVFVKPERQKELILPGPVDLQESGGQFLALLKEYGTRHLG